MNELSKGKIPIEMGKVKSEQGNARKKVAGILFCMVIMLAALAIAWVWILGGEISTDYAIVDGQSYIVIAPFDDTLQELLVRENQVVSQGQIVAKMSIANKNDVAIAQNILQYATSMPDTISDRAQHIEKLEADIVERIAQLRIKEAAKKKIFEQKVQTHVRTQLYLRNLSAGLGLGEKANQNHVAASKNVEEEKKAMDSAKLEFEEASMLRAAIESELMAMRNDAKVNNNRNVRIANSYLNKIQKIKELSIIRAPVDGKVAKIFSEIGQKLVNQQAILQIVPISSQRLVVIAYFSKEQLESIKVGQNSIVSLDLEQEILLNGVVESIETEGHSAVPNDMADAPKLYPVIIKLTMPEKEDNLEILPGMKAFATVYTRKLFSFF